MRIRKQPRQLPACRDSFLPCDFQEGGWSNREYSEMGNGGGVFSGKTAGAVDSREQLVAGAMVPQIIDHVKSDPDTIEMSRMPESQSADLLQQVHNIQDIPTGVSQVIAGEDKMEDQEKGKVQECGKFLPTSVGLNFVAKVEEGLVRGQSSSPSVETEMTNVDQKNLLGAAYHPESYIQVEDEDDYDNPTRHYVRRGFRNSGDGVIQIQSDENIPDEDKDSAVPKNNIYERDQFPYSEKKDNPDLPETTRDRPKFARPALPSHSSEDDDHPSREPEGSLLHSLYLQLLAAGREGISLRGLFASFESQTSLPRLAHNWREQVKAHLKDGPYFEEVKGRYLLCEFLVQPSSKRTAKRKENYESSGVQTRRKAYQKTIEAVLSESAMEFQKQRQHQTDNGGRSGAPSPSMLTESTESDLDMTEPTIVTKSKSAPVRSSKSRKSKMVDDQDLQVHRNIRYGGAIPGSLKAMQARIIAETGVQDGVRCARKDGSNDSSKWQCPMMAPEGHTLCEHHSFLNERKRARYAKARKHHGEGTIGKSPRSRQTKLVAPEVPRVTQYMTQDMKRPSAPGAEIYKSDSDDLAELDEVVSQTLLTMKSDILAVESLTQEKPVYVSNYNCAESDSSEPATPAVNEETTIRASNCKSAPQIFARSPTGRFIAAKKTAVKTPTHSLETETSLGKSSVPLIRPPSIPPLPAFYGARRKTVKNRSLLSIS